MVKYIIFDLDGVLVDARELHYEAMNRALRTHGYEITREEHLSTYDGLPTRKKLELLTKQKGLPASLYDQIWQEKQRQTHAIIDTEHTFDARMRDVLAKLKADGYTLAVCSNSVRDTVKIMLLRTGLMEYIDLFLSNEDVLHPKPHPEMYMRAMILLGAAPKECVVVEDSHHGRAAAHAAGAYVCGVRNPTDVTYERILQVVGDVAKQAKHRIDAPKWQGGTMRIVIPMAGEGKSYQRAGFAFPKPLVDINGKPMIQWAVENINTEGHYIFIVQREQYEKYNLKYLFNLIAPGFEVVLLDEPTQGAAQSVLAAQHLITPDDPLVIVNSDQTIEWNSNEFFYAMAADECDGGIVTFESTHPKWSYVRIGEDGFIAETAEKKPISNRATCGVYYFARGDDFITYAKQMIAKQITFNNEYFVCPVYNELIAAGLKVRQFPVERMWSFSTPEDLSMYLQQHTDNRLPSLTPPKTESAKQKFIEPAVASFKRL